MGRFCLLSDIRKSRGQGLAKLENHSPCGYKLQNNDVGGEAAGVLKPFSVGEGRVLPLGEVPWGPSLGGSALGAILDF